MLVPILTDFAVYLLIALIAVSSFVVFFQLLDSCESLHNLLVAAISNHLGI
jgi:hypothetical protein